MSGWQFAWQAEHSLRRIAAVPLLVLLAVACANLQTVVRWQKDGARAGELEQARKACEQQPGAEQVQIGRDRVEAEVRANAFVRCMEQRGWTWSTYVANEE